MHQIVSVFMVLNLLSYRFLLMVLFCGCLLSWTAVLAQPRILPSSSPAKPNVGASRQAASGLQTIENDQIRVGINTDYGGAITYLAFKDNHGGLVSTQNIVNNFDLGRQVQIALYGGPLNYSSSNPYWTNLGWNPIQVGDYYHNPSQVVSIDVQSNQLYAKTIPYQFALNKVPGEATIEHWIRLEGSVVKVHAKITMARSDRTQYAARQQEFPCMYLNGDYHNIMYYKDGQPFTNGGLATDRLASPQTSFYGDAYPTEPWMASVNDNHYGVGMYVPGIYEWKRGYFGPDMTGDEYASATSYVGADFHVLLDYNMTYEWDYALILGHLNDIRSYVYNQTRPSTGPEYVFDTSRKGWYYENTTDTGLPISGKLHVDLSDAVNARVFSPYAAWKGSDVSKIYVRAAFSTPNNTFRLNWRRVDDVTLYGSGDRIVDFPITNDGQFHTYTIDVSNNPNWQNYMIGQLEFQPVATQSTPGAWAEFAWVSTNPNGPTTTPTPVVCVSGCSMVNMKKLSYTLSNRKR